MSLLQCRQLQVSIGGRDICRELALSVNPGEVWGLLGPSGAGKTTLLHCLAGLYPPQAGTLHYHETPLTELDMRNRALQRGLLLQDTSEPFPGTVLEAVMTGRHPHLRPWQWESGKDLQLCEQALDQLGLAGLQQRQLGTLSGGERQRVAIAALLAQDPRLFMLDEPTSHLDLRHVIVLMKLLRQLARDADKGILMVLHDPGLAARYCDRVLLLFGDGSHLAGSATELLQSDHLGRLYGQALQQVDSAYGPLFVPID